MGVLVLSQHIETTHAVELDTLGAFGYLLKDAYSTWLSSWARRRVSPRAARRSTRRSWRGSHRQRAHAARFQSRRSGIARC